MTATPEKAHVVKDYACKRPLISCRFDASGRYVFAGAEDNAIHRWELATGKEALLAGHESWVFAIASHPKDDLIVSGGCDGRLIWWRASEEKPAAIRRVEAHRGWVRSLAVSPDGSILASCGNDRMVRLWSFADGTPLGELPGHELPVYRVLFAPSGRSLLSADLRGLVIEWDFRPGKEARRLDAGKLSKHNAAGQGVDYGGVRDLSLSGDSKYLACGGLIEATNPLGAISNPAVIVFDWQTGKESSSCGPRKTSWGWCRGCDFTRPVS